MYAKVIEVLHYLARIPVTFTAKHRDATVKRQHRIAGQVELKAQTKLGRAKRKAAEIVSFKVLKLYVSDC